MTFPAERKRAGRVARLVVTIAIVALAVLTGGEPASAHGGTDTDASNFLITVTAPGDDGLDWRVYGGDALLELTNRTGRPVTVVGYQDEPYLRFVPGDGIYENLRSPATYLNQERSGVVDVPDDADADAAPQWQRVSTADTYGWHDHRAHWMSPDLPPRVAAEPDQRHEINQWTISVQLDDGRTVEAAGTLSWVPPPPWWPPILAVGATFGAVLAAAAAWTRPGPERWPGLSRAVGALVVLIVVANLIRTIDDAAASPADSGTKIGITIVSMIALVAVTGLAAAGWSGYPIGFIALAAAALLCGLLFASGSSGQLTASQLVTTLPTWVRRYTVSATYLLPVPAFAAA
ncbi:MAG: hypothetical protein ACRDZ2_03225, partial [Ilumatobacteraceae bacterium]